MTQQVVSPTASGALRRSVCGERQERVERASRAEVCFKYSFRVAFLPLPTLMFAPPCAQTLFCFLHTSRGVGGRRMEEESFSFSALLFHSFRLGKDSLTLELGDLIFIRARERGNLKLLARHTYIYRRKSLLLQSFSRYIFFENIFFVFF